MILALVLPAGAAALPVVSIFIDGEPLACEVAPSVINGRTMVPLAAVSQGLGAQVEWKPDSRRVLITSRGSSPVPLDNPITSGNAPIRVFINGRQLSLDVSPAIISNRTMVPLAAISQGLGAQVEWQAASRRVLISTQGGNKWPEALPAVAPPPFDTSITIRGQSLASAEQLRALLRRNNPSAPDLVDLYLQIGRQYDIRGDIAFCQAAKETGWWKFGGLVLPEQNNYCGLGATGRAATGTEDLHGANPSRVRYIADMHGAFFTSPADGVEAQIQHLYAYACTDPLPAGKDIVDPRYTLVRRGVAPLWTDLNGRWAVPGIGYGESIVNNYYIKAFL